MCASGVVMGTAALIAGACAAGSGGRDARGAAADSNRLIEQAHALVADRFYSPARLEKMAWPSRLGEALVAAERAERAGLAERAAAAGAIREMLALLEASHTALYKREQREWFDVLDIFAGSPALKEDVKRLFPPEGAVMAPSVGLVIEHVEGEGWFAREVIAGSSAAGAGILPGDRIVDVEGTDELEGHVGAGLPMGMLADGEVRIGAQRERGGPIVEHTLKVRLVSPREEYLRLMSDSVRVFERTGARVGYVRIYSWAGLHYQERLEELVADEPLRSADGLVIDVRDGWGGASPRYLGLFNRASPELSLITREGERRDFNAAWVKPVALLVNGGTRSGNEIMAHAFRKHGVGKVVGARTAGAVLGGQPLLLEDDSVLYLAVTGALVDGAVMEGVGVEPDIAVARDLPYSAGRDPQVEAAVDAVAEEVRRRVRR